MILADSIIQFPCQPEIVLSVGVKQVMGELVKIRVQFLLLGNFYDDCADSGHSARIAPHWEIALQPVTRLSSCGQGRAKFRPGSFAASEYLLEEGLEGFGGYSEDIAHGIAKVRVGWNAIDCRQAAVNGLKTQLSIENSEADGGSVRKIIQQLDGFVKRLTCYHASLIG